MVYVAGVRRQGAGPGQELPGPNLMEWPDSDEQTPTLH